MVVRHSPDGAFMSINVNASVLRLPQVSFVTLQPITCLVFGVIFVDRALLQRITIDLNFFICTQTFSSSNNCLYEFLRNVLWWLYTATNTCCEEEEQTCLCHRALTLTFFIDWKHLWPDGFWFDLDPGGLHTHIHISLLFVYHQDLNISCWSCGSYLSANSNWFSNFGAALYVNNTGQQNRFSISRLIAKTMATPSTDFWLLKLRDFVLLSIDSRRKVSIWLCGLPFVYFIFHARTEQSYGLVLFFISKEWALWNSKPAM